MTVRPTVVAAVTTWSDVPLPAGARLDVKLVVLFRQLHLRRVTDLRRGLDQKLSLQLAEPPARCAQQVVGGGSAARISASTASVGMRQSITEVRLSSPY